MIVYSDEALDMRELRNYYERKDRIEAIISLNAAMLEAETSIDRSPRVDCHHHGHTRDWLGLAGSG